MNTVAQEKKKHAKELIMTMLAERKQVTNNDVEALAHVSDATATRYLEELEKEGKIEKKGGGGRGAYYEIKK